jgi:hypothetical protein
MMTVKRFKPSRNLLAPVIALSLIAGVIASIGGWVHFRKKNVPANVASLRRASKLDTNIADWRVENIGFKRAMDQLSAATGAKIEYISDFAIPCDDTIARIVGVPTICEVRLSLHLRNVTLAAALNVIIQIADEQANLDLQYSIEPDGRIQIRDLDENPPPIVRTIEAGDLLKADELALDQEQSVLDPPPAPLKSAQILARSKDRLGKLIQNAVAPGRWDPNYTPSCRLTWFGTCLVLVAPAPECAQVEQLVNALRGGRDGRQAWPPIPLLETPIADLQIENEPLNETLEALSKASGVNIVADAFVLAEAMKRPLTLHLHHSTLRVALDHLMSRLAQATAAPHYRVINNVVLVTQGDRSPEPVSWLLYDIRKLATEYQADLLQYRAYDEPRPQVDAISGLLDMIQEYNWGYGNMDLSEQDVFGGLLVARFHPQMQLRIAALLDLLEQAAANPTRFTYDSREGLTYMPRHSAQALGTLTRLYNVRDLVDRAAKEFRYSGDQEASTAPARSIVARNLKTLISRMMTDEELRNDQGVQVLGEKLIIDATLETHSRIDALLKRLRAADRNPELEAN